MSVYETGKPITLELGNILERSLDKIVELRADKIYPSSSSECPRKSVALTLLPETAIGQQTIVNQLYFKIGSAVESVIVSALEAGSILRRREFVVKRDWKKAHVSGRIDAIIELGGCLYPLEIKSCGANLPSSPKPNHQSQLMTYMVATGLKKGFLIYVSRTVADWKQNMKYKIFPIEMDSDLLLSYALNLATVLVYANAQLLPQIPFENKKPCKYCPLIDYCWPKDELFEDPYGMAKYEHTGKGPELDKIVEYLRDRIIFRQPDYLDETEKAIYGESHF